MSAASVPDPCLHLDGGDQGEASGSEAPTGQEADTLRGAAQIFRLRDPVCPPSLMHSAGSLHLGLPSPSPVVTGHPPCNGG